MYAYFQPKISVEQEEAYIKEMIDRKDFKAIRYCRIYASGECGMRKVVL